MARYEITAPDGKRYEINAPDDASEGDVMAYAQANFKSAAPSKAEPAKREAVGSISAGLEGAAQGLTFGFSDELEGLGRAAYAAITEGKGFGDAYGEGVEKPRERIRAAKETNPIAFYAGEIGSSMVVPGALAKLGVKGALANSAGKSLGARMVAGAKEGAAYGAAYGAGTAEGDIGDRVEGAGKGALTGAGVGAVLPAAIDAGGAIVNKVTTPFRAAMRPTQVANEKVAEAFARDMGGAPAGAVNRLEQRIQNAGNDPIVGRPNMMVADFGGENVRNLTRAAANMPNDQSQRLKRVLDQRQASQAGRIEGDLASTLGPTHDFHTTVDNLVKRMDDVGKNHIQKSFAIETPMTPNLKRVLERPTMKELHSLASRRLADEGREIGLLNRTEMIHRMKMELDDQIGIAKRAETMGNKPQAGWDARTLTVLKRDLLDAVNNEPYKRGLKIYAGEARLKNAAEDGFDDFSKMPIEKMQQKLKGYDTDQERSMFRLGAARNIVDQVRRGNALRDRTENVFASPDMQLRMQVIFPDQESRREFQKALVLEAKMSDTRKAVQGNSTTAKQLMQAGEAGQAVETGRNIIGAMTGRIEPILNLISRQAQRFSGITPETAGEILNVMMQNKLGNMRPAIEQAMLEAARTPQQRADLARYLASAQAAAITDAPARGKRLEPQRFSESDAAPSQEETEMLRVIDTMLPGYEPGQRESTNVEIAERFDKLSTKQKAEIFTKIFGNEMGSLGKRMLKSMSKSLGLGDEVEQQLLPGPRR